MSKATKTGLIIASALVLIGCVIFGGVMTMLRWDFTKLSTTEYETNEYEISQSYKSIAIRTKTADVLIAPAEGEKSTVTCREQKNRKHTVAVQDGTLTIEIHDTRKWYEHIGIYFGSGKITVYLPQAEYEALSARASTGNIRVEDITAGALDLSVSTGKITLSDAVCTGDVKINVSTGKATLTDLQCKNLESEGNTGDLSLKNVIAAGKFAIERSTGDVKLEGCDAAELWIRTDTGDVKGSLLTEKIFIARTSTGDIDVPKTATGGKCEITTSTGDIKIEIK